ncbi:hypothetical protein DMUE_4184 [Dictyocoela muelleri]|nr:hypothetical protein DMUE_4184 [Dictyocoela muelleri]
MRNTKIGEEMYVSILSIFRKKISNYVNQNRRKLGGILKEIQIDETFWAKRKYNVGYVRISVRIWGCIEFKTRYCYCQVVDDRKATTLLPKINQQIEKKSYIVSDKWAAYNRIQNAYHEAVNHTYNFVDQITKANTRKIENLWLHLKKIKHFSYRISIDTLSDHLNIFMFFFKNYKNIELVDFLTILFK